MGLFGFPKDYDIVPIKKQINDMLRATQKKIKPDKCILCGQSKNGYCNSHSVPQMVLRSIAEQGKILQANAVVELELLDSEKGINNSGTFHFICNDCDSKYFREYENPVNLMAKPSDRMLAEIALKDNLIQLYKRKQEIELISTIQSKKQTLKNFELFEKMKSLDINEYAEEVYFYQTIIDKNEKNGFHILYWKLLPYKTPIAVQTMIALTEDRDNQQVNDIYSTSEEIRIENMHLCVFPLDKATVVLAFYHKRDRNYRNLRHQFNSASDEENLKYLNWLIFKYSENYFFSKSIKEVLDSNEKLKKLSQESGGYPNLGMVSAMNLINGYTAITMDEIPNFLDIEYAI